MKDTTYQQRIDVEKLLHDIEYTRGLYQPLSSEELSELPPILKNAVLDARESDRYNNEW